MDNELKNLRLNINQLAAVTDLHRQTISSRLNNVEPAPGSNSRLKLYSVVDILRELLGRTTAPELVDIDKMLPPDRKAWFQSERERLKFQQETGELIPASTVTREFSSMAKAVVQVLETLPDILERDCAMTPAAVVRVQKVIDDLRDQIALKVEQADTPESGEYKQNGKQSSLQDAFETLGFKAGDFAGLSDMAQFDKIVERALSLQDESKASFALDSLFGGEASKLLMLIKQSGRSYRDLMDEQRRYNLVTKEGADGAVAGNQAINNLRTVFSSAVAEISGQLGNELAPDIRRLTDDLADWFKGGGVRRIVTFLRNDLYPGVLSFGQGVVFVGKIIYALAKKLSWLLPDDLNDQRDVLKTLAANGVERARFRASQNGQGEWFEQQLKDRPDLPEKVKRSWESTRGLFGFDSDDETFNKSLERYLSPEGGDTLLNWNTALQRNKGRSVQPPSDSSGGDIGYWDTLLQRMDNLDKQPPSRQVTDNRKFEYRFEINAAPGQDEKAIADEVTTVTKNNSAFNGDNSLLDGGLLW